MANERNEISQMYQNFMFNENFLNFIATGFQFICNETRNCSCINLTHTGIYGYHLTPHPPPPIFSSQE